MEHKSLSKLEIGYGGYRYFPPALHPKISKIGQKQFSHPSAYEYHDELEFIFVRSGTGQLLVNHRSFPITRGSMGLFMGFDMHRFLPTPGETLTVDYLRISYGTYCYVMACPYLAPADINLACYHFRPKCFFGETLDDLEAQIDRLRGLSGDAALQPMGVFLLIELIGRYQRGLDLPALSFESEASGARAYLGCNHELPTCERAQEKTDFGD